MDDKVGALAPTVKSPAEQGLGRYPIQGEAGRAFLHLVIASPRTELALVWDVAIPTKSQIGVLAGLLLRLGRIAMTE